jgi:hypothetical protein
MESKLDLKPDTPWFALTDLMGEFSTFSGVIKQHPLLYYMD